MEQLDLIPEEGEPLNDQQGRLKRLSTEYAVYKDELKLLEGKVDEMKEKIKKVNDELLPLMREADITSFKTPRGTFYINTQTRCSVNNSELAFPYLRSIGCELLIKETVNSQSLSSDIRKLAEEGKIILTELPNQGISVYVDESVRLRGGKNVE